MAEAGEKLVFEDCCRVWLQVQRGAATKPIKFFLSSSAHVFQVLRSAKCLFSMHKKWLSCAHPPHAQLASFRSSQHIRESRERTYRLAS